VGLGVDSGSAYYEVIVFLAVGFEFHFVFVEGEFDGGVGREDVLPGGFRLADLIFGGRGADGVLLAEETGGLLFVLLLGAASDGGFRDDCGGGGSLIRRGDGGAKSQDCECRDVFPHRILLLGARKFQDAIV
jgi:hypothetical protein